MIKYHYDTIQGSQEWLDLRCGLLTASEMKFIITPSKLEYSKAEKSFSHLLELTAQRITKYVEPHYVGDDMLRGRDDEVDAKVKYEEKYGAVRDCGFIVNDKWGFPIGYSPDGLIGDDGLMECKGRRSKFQLDTIVEMKMPEEFLLQVQTGLLVSERKWLDFVSYCGGMHMFVLRIYPDLKIHNAIVNAATIFDKQSKELMEKYRARLSNKELRLVPTERRIEKKITL